MILPAEWRSLNNFSSQPIGTGPYSVTRNNSNQLKIRAFDDYFGYRALIDEVNVWVLPDLNEELSAGLTTEGPTAGEKAFESRPEEGCYYLLFDSRSHRGANHDVRRWISHILAPANLIYHAEEQYQTGGSRPMACFRAGTMRSQCAVKTCRTGDHHPQLLSRSH